MTVQSKLESLVEILKTGWILWKSSFKQTLPFAALCVLSNFAFETILLSLGLFNEGEGPYNPNDWTDYSGHIEFFMVAFLIYGVLFLISHAGIILNINATAKNRILSFNEAVSISIKKLFSLFLVTVFYLLTSFVGFLCFAIPGILVVTYLLFSSYLLVITDLGVIDSLRESIRLVSKHWWHVAGVWGVSFLGILLLPFFIQGIFPPRLEMVLLNMLSLLTYPLFDAVIMALMFDLQRRKARTERALHTIQA